MGTNLPFDPGTGPWPKGFIFLGTRVLGVHQAVAI
jgi:hypothetical protein